MAPYRPIGAVAEGAAAMAEFGVLVRRIWSRWPATTARSARFRVYSGIMYWQVLGALATGQPPNPHYYLHSIQAIEHRVQRGRGQRLLGVALGVHRMAGNVLDHQHAVPIGVHKLGHRHRVRPVDIAARRAGAGVRLPRPWVRPGSRCRS
jgi:hypothetical protein